MCILFSLSLGVNERDPPLYGGRPEPEVLAAMEREGYRLDSHELGDIPTLPVFLNSPLHDAALNLK